MEESEQEVHEQHIPVEVGYQSYISTVAAIAGMAGYYMLDSAGFHRLYAAAAAIGALGANLTFQYALQGSIKEIGFVATLFVAAAIARFPPPQQALG